MILSNTLARPLALVSLLSVAACGGSSPSPAAAAPAAAADAGATVTGKTFATADDAPKYEGTNFKGMQIFDREGDVYLDEAAFMAALDDEKLIFFGEQHETAPVQELELWTLQRITERHDDVTLAMEHFQHDAQSVIDGYVAGKISSGAFETQSDPWKNYEKYWKPLVDHMKSISRPVVGLNVPDEALDMIYAAYPKKPLEVFNAWDGSFKYAASIAPRPLPAWDKTYQSYFEGSFDYATHGKQMGMSPAEALTYFTDLALIRDETMAYFTSKALEEGGRAFVVAGDWHVQTGLATPDRAIRYRGDGATYQLVTTTPVAKLGEVKDKTISGRKLARFILVYQ